MALQTENAIRNPKPIKGLTQKQIEELDHDAVVNKYDDWQKGKISRDEYTIFILEILENYIKSLIARDKRTLGAEFEDLMSAAYCRIISQIDAYDPHRTKPNSYFTKYIEEALRNEVQPSKTTAHYSGKAAKLDRIARSLGFEDCTAPGLKADKLAILAELPLRTVLETIRLKKHTVTSIETCTEALNVESGFKAPEQSCLDNERSEFLEAQYNKCTPLEQYLLSMVIMNDPDYRLSYRALIPIMKGDEMQERFKDELKGYHVDQLFLEQVVNKALRRIKYTPEMRGYVPQESYDVEVFEQAPLEDIENAMLSELKVIN